MKNPENGSQKIDFSVVWDGIKSFARKAGRTAARPVLLLWFVMRSDSTPRKDKLMILAAIAYVVLPIDLISANRWLLESVGVPFCVPITHTPAGVSPIRPSTLSASLSSASHACPKKACGRVSAKSPAVYPAI